MAGNTGPAPLSPGLEERLSAVELRLAELGNALLSRDDSRLAPNRSKSGRPSPLMSPDAIQTGVSANKLH